MRTLEFIWVINENSLIQYEFSCEIYTDKRASNNWDIGNESWIQGKLTHSAIQPTCRTASSYQQMCSLTTLPVTSSKVTCEKGCRSILDYNGRTKKSTCCTYQVNLLGDLPRFSSMSYWVIILHGIIQWRCMQRKTGGCIWWLLVDWMLCITNQHRYLTRFKRYCLHLVYIWHKP